MEGNEKVRWKANGKVYGDITDHGDFIFASRLGSSHHVRIPKNEMEIVPADAVDIEVAPPAITGGAIMPEDLDRIKKERGDK